MIIRTDTNISFSGTNWADNLYNYLSQFLTGLTHTAGDNTLTFSNGVVFKAQIYGSPTFYINCNGTDKAFASPGFFADGVYNLTTIKTDTFFVVRIYRVSGAGGGSGNGVCFSWIKDTDNNKYYAGGVGAADIVSYYSIDNYTFYDATDSATSSYSMPKMINFKAGVGKIAYSNLVPVSDGTYHSFYAKDLYSCSTVDVGDTISLANGKNLLAVGTNTAIEITI